jgi:hypothetical protein
MQLFADPLQILAGVMAFVATVWGLLRLYATKSQPVRPQLVHIIDRFRPLVDNRLRTAVKLVVFTVSRPSSQDGNLHRGCQFFRFQQSAPFRPRLPPTRVVFAFALRSFASLSPSNAAR